LRAFSTQNRALYHYGPVVIKEKGKWVAKASEPTTSGRNG